MTATSIEIRHRIAMDGGSYLVIENVGTLAEIRWRVPTRSVADALVAERKRLLLKMISDISATAKAAVEDARHIDNMKAGHA